MGENDKNEWQGNSHVTAEQSLLQRMDQGIDDNKLPCILLPYSDVLLCIPSSSEHEGYRIIKVPPALEVA